MNNWGWAALFAAAILGHYLLPSDWVPFVFGAVVWIAIIYMGHKIDDLTIRIAELEKRDQ